MTTTERAAVTRRFRAAYFITVTIVVVLVLGVGVLFYRDLSLAQRANFIEVLPKLAIYCVAAFVACLLLFNSMLRYFFREYIDPIVRLTTEAQLIGVAEAKYRIPDAGGPEVVALTGVINDIADKHLALKTDVQKVVELARAEVQGEKQRFEALTAQMPDGVVVCNLDGRILLYNHRAQAVVGRPGVEATHLGIGRSIFGLFGRLPFVHALNVLQRRLDRDRDRSPFTFVTALEADRILRVRMSAIVAPESTEIEGYVLLVADITERILADSRRDMFLQSLTIELQRELGKIRDAVAVLQASPGAGPPVTTIERSSNALLERIDAVAVQHARRLLDPGDAEYILGEDLLQMLRRTVEDDFGVRCATRCDGDLWLNLNSYTVIRGAVYLLGQLTAQLGVDEVELRLARAEDAAMLVVGWSGGAVERQRIEQWKECPLMLGGSGRGTVSLATLLAGRGDVVEGTGPEEAVASVRFRLQMAPHEAHWVAEALPEERPVYYDFGLFEADGGRTDLDDRPLSDLTYVVLDTETTGLEPNAGDEIISFGAVRIVRGRLRREEMFDRLVDPRRSIPLESLRIHRITPEMLRGMPLVTDVLAQFHHFAEGAVLVAHNAAFDMRFIKLKEAAAGVSFDHPVLDTLLLSSVAYSTDEPHNLDTVAARLGVPIVGRHTALGDALVTAEVLLKLIPLLEAKGVRTLAEARAASRQTPYSSIEF